MTDKLEQLTKQIYEEGVEKARQEAARIMASAEEEKRKILRAAREEAADIISASHREAEELKHRVESELRMASAQSLALLRQKITDLICVQTAEQSVNGIFDDPNFLKRILDTVMKEWISHSCKPGQEIYLKLPQKMQAEIQEYLFKKGKQALDTGIKVVFSEDIGSGFQITPQDGSYRIGFTEEDFKALILHFLRPRVKKFLFGHA
jgi:V/A-type H+-transporting ATPase subunit E